MSTTFCASKWRSGGYIILHGPYPSYQDGKYVYLHTSIIAKVIVAIAMAEDVYDLILSYRNVARASPLNPVTSPSSYIGLEDLGLYNTK